MDEGLDARIGHPALSTQRFKLLYIDCAPNRRRLSGRESDRIGFFIDALAYPIDPAKAQGLIN